MKEPTTPVPKDLRAESEVSTFKFQQTFERRAVRHSVDPNKQIAKGYETLVITLNNGRVLSGILKSEDDKLVNIMTPEGQTLRIPKADIDDRSRGPSAMPSDVAQKLTRSEVRDLVEFLAGLQ